MNGVLIRGKCGHKHTGRTQYRDGGRDYSDASTNQEIPRTVSKPQTLKTYGGDSLLRPQERTNPAATLISNFWPP